MNNTISIEEIQAQLKTALNEYFEQVALPKNGLFVLGFSTSEVLGSWMGQNSSQEVGDVVINTLLPTLKENQLNLAVQGCQHINRALLVEREVAESHGYEIVSVVPQIHAGGAGQVAAYKAFKDPVEVEHIIADGGMDIGDTQIAMHVRWVQIPVKTATKQIGEAHITFLTSRPKLIGGPRAIYEMPNNQL